MTTTVTVTADFSSAHFYAQPAWSEEKNRAEFGRCFTRYGHGHNYRAQATFLNSAAADAFAKSLGEVTRVLDHEHLNFVIPEFATLVPTTENIALWIWDRLKQGARGPSLRKLKLFETDDLWVEIEA